MEKKKNSNVVAIIFAVLFLALIVWNYWPGRMLPKEMPKDFAFVYRYGSKGKNILDTKRGTFTKDMVVDPSITAKLDLTEAELSEIYAEMRRIRITNYPRYFRVLQRNNQSHYENFRIDVYYDGHGKSIIWNDNCFEEIGSTRKLRGLFMRMKEMIQEHEEYKRMPEPRAGYA